jgi:peptide deformylase
MAIKPIRLFGDPVLTDPCAAVTTFDRELRRLVADLDDTLRDARGSGLAAPQLGVGMRVFVFHVEGAVGHLVNPTLSFPDEREQDGPEGCLSMPGLYFDTKRRQHVVAAGFSAHGDPVRVVGDGHLARCLQHETDHLDGVLFIDRMDTERRRAAMKAIRDADWSAADRARVRLSPHPLGRGLG